MRLDDDDDDDDEYAPPRSRGRRERADSPPSRRGSSDKDGRRRINDDRFGDDDRGRMKNRETETSYKDRQEKEEDLHKQIKSTWVTPAEEENGKGEKKGQSIIGKAKLDVMQVAVGAQMMLSLIHI